jgi:uncharacterized membrane protein YtjA (UPF0391 family)
MLLWPFTFFIISIVEDFLGFKKTAGHTVKISKLLFFAFLVFFAVSLLLLQVSDSNL